MASSCKQAMRASRHASKQAQASKQASKRVEPKEACRQADSPSHHHTNWQRRPPCKHTYRGPSLVGCHDLPPQQLQRGHRAAQPCHHALRNAVGLCACAWWTGWLHSLHALHLRNSSMPSRDKGRCLPKTQDVMQRDKTCQDMPRHAKTCQDMKKSDSKQEGTCTPIEMPACSWRYLASGLRDSR